ncbi:hypothetical protein GCM10010308_22220 [Streptomyces vinaceusdrappus]|nr:hypothetical protein GCM10010308_22220 [Streptomyces vinaceusdrappus]
MDTGSGDCGEEDCGSGVVMLPIVHDGPAKPHSRWSATREDAGTTARDCTAATRVDMLAW